MLTMKLSRMALKPPTLKFMLRNLPSQIRHYSAPGEGPIPPSKLKYIPTSGTYPKGFLAGGTHVGVKASNTTRDDLALIVSEIPASGAAVFTKNNFQAAPVTVSRDILRKRAGKGIRSIIVNSGCANAVTGRGGIQDAYVMSEETDKCLMALDKDEGQGPSTMVMSTGVIGQRFASPNPQNMYFLTPHG